MFKIPLLEIISKIQAKTGLDRQTIDLKIKQKMDELSGLISEEGAAHILANECGVKLITGLESSRLCVNNIIPGLRNVSSLARVINQSDVREWNKGEKNGKIASLFLGDDTGKIRLVLWNEAASVLENNQLKGKVIHIKYVIARESNRGVELHSKVATKIELEPNHPDINKIPVFADFQENITENRPSIEYTRKDISAASNQDFSEFRAVVVQVFDRIVFFEQCPECRKRARRENGTWSCGQHNFQNPMYSMVLNAVIDDGTGTIRTTFFGNHAESLLGMKINNIRTMFPEKLTDEKIREVIGKELIISGRISYNEQFERRELQVRRIRIPNYINEAGKIIEKLSIS